MQPKTDPESDQMMVINFPYIIFHVYQYNGKLESHLIINFIICLKVGTELLLIMCQFCTDNNLIHFLLNDSKFQSIWNPIESVRRH